MSTEVAERPVELFGKSCVRRTVVGQLRLEAEPEAIRAARRELRAALAAKAAEAAARSECPAEPDAEPAELRPLPPVHQFIAVMEAGQRLKTLGLFR